MENASSEPLIRLEQKGAHTVSTLGFSDPLVRLELLAVALDRGVDAVDDAVRAGDIPPRTVRRDKRTTYWQLSELRAWNPKVAKRLDMLLLALS